MARRYREHPSLTRSLVLTMASPAQLIVFRIQEALQDFSGTRWPASELVRHINEGQRFIVTRRPDLKATHVTFACVAGARQTIPATAMLLMDVGENASGRKSAITKVDRKLLDATAPNWLSLPGASVIEHFTHDLAESRDFMVYPPARAGVEVTLNVANYPTDVPAPAAPGRTFSTASGNTDLPAGWESALINFGLFRAYSKDAEFGGNAELAASYFGLVQAEVGEQAQASAIAAPKE